MKVVVGSGRGGTSVYTAVGGAGEGCDNSVPKARNKCKLNSHIVETNKPERLLKNCVIKLPRVKTIYRKCASDFLCYICLIR